AAPVSVVRRARAAAPAPVGERPATCPCRMLRRTGPATGCRTSGTWPGREWGRFAWTHEARARRRHRTRRRRIDVRQGTSASLSPLQIPVRRETRLVTVDLVSNVI